MSFSNHQEAEIDDEYLDEIEEEEEEAPERQPIREREQISSSSSSSSQETATWRRANVVQFPYLIIYKECKEEQVIFGFLDSWFVDQPGSKISFTKIQTLPNFILFATLDYGSRTNNITRRFPNGEKGLFHLGPSLRIDSVQYIEWESKS